ncbi:hypothetical protein [Deinococcus aestuarii]|uniref:hypothetical protein n=1 Tax=Deinococcus aestuarii TaxID=2774531 RepID=UPI001C0CB1B8|nr:hypothetical protein [Deinococcus aestuarii]
MSEATWRDHIALGAAADKGLHHVRVGEKYFGVSRLMYDLLSGLSSQNVPVDEAATLRHLQQTLSYGQSQKVYAQLQGFVAGASPSRSLWQSFLRGLIKFPLWRPSAAWTARFQGRILTPARVALSVLLGLASLGVAVVKSPALPPITAVGLGEVLTLWVLIIATTLVHELGHAMVAAHYGVRPRSVGVAIFFLQPAGYADVSDTWLYDRRVRFATALGGFMFQIYPLALASALWYATSNPLLGHYCLINLGYFVINLIPFVRTDGYWLLSNALGENNLMNKGTFTLRTLLRDPGQLGRMGAGDLSFALFGLASSLYVTGLYAYSLGFLWQLVPWRGNVPVLGVMVGLLLIGLIVREALRRRRVPRAQGVV